MAQLAYAASKAALERFTIGLAAELAGTGVAVNCVRVDEQLLSEALLSMLPDHADPDAHHVTPDEFGVGVRHVVDLHDDVTGRILRFADLREMGALPR